MATLEDLWPIWLETVVLWWDDDGRPIPAAGPWATSLPGTAPVFAITAWNPQGEVLPDDENARRHGELLRWALEEVGEPFLLPDGWDPDDGLDGEAPSGRTWFPAAGVGLAPGPPELGLLLVGVDREEALEAGRRFDQLALFELTDREQLVLPSDGSPASGRSRSWREPSEWGAVEGAWLDADVLGGWWDEHVRALRAHGIGVRGAHRCPTCGRATAWTLWGMVDGPGAPWIHLGGCCIETDRPRWCDHCDRAREWWADGPDGDG